MIFMLAMVFLQATFAQDEVFDPYTTHISRLSKFKLHGRIGAALLVAASN